LGLAGREIFHQHGNVADATAEFLRERVDHLLHDLGELVALHVALLLQLSGDGVLPGRLVPLNVEHIGLAANLTVLDVGLLRSGRGGNDGLVSLPATRALESGRHLSFDALGA